jgi:hypothetical protein
MTEQEDPGVRGWWEPIQYRFSHLPIHMALLHTGKVLAFGGSGNDRRNLRAPKPAEIWDPQSGVITTVDQAVAGDFFCVGQTFLSDGRLLVAGGTHKYDNKLFGLPIPPFRGLEQSYTFDPRLENWTRVQDMKYGRWYPTLIMLADGRVLALAGLTKRLPWVFLRHFEIYEPGQGWRNLAGTERWLPLYPRLHLLPNRHIFYAGSYNTHYTFPFTVKGFPTALLDVDNREWQTVGLPNQSQREEGASILLPLTPPDYRAQVLLVGGGTPLGQEAVADAELIDLSEPAPHWRPLPPMAHPRYYAYSVILPDKQVLVVGGRRGHKGHHVAPDFQRRENGPGRGEFQRQEVPQDPRAIRTPECFDPVTGEWTPMAPMAVDRLYHSNALLLPDGRIMVAGSNPRPGVNELRIEIFHPPYLFKGPRPRIELAPASATYGEAIEIEAPQADQIEEVALIRPSATTHCLNTDQRYVGLAFDMPRPGKLVANIPDNPNLIPPGYYMLFIVRAGIPSEARFVHLV